MEKITRCFLNFVPSESDGNRSIVKSAVNESTLVSIDLRKNLLKMLDFSSIFQIGLGISIGVMFSYPRAVLIIVKNLKRDVGILLFFAKLFVNVVSYVITSKTVPKRFNELTNKNPNKVAFYYEDQQWTFRQVDELSNKVGNFFKKQGYKRGDGVALLFDSKPEFVCLYLGLAKIGVVTGFLNNNIVSEEALAHALKCAKTKTIIYGSKFRTVISKCITTSPDLKAYYYNDLKEDVDKDAVDLSRELEKSPSTYIKEMEDGKVFDKLIYIFTSGTTGLPKASVITNLRYVLISTVFSSSVITDEDVIYTAVPLYHSLGGIAGTGQVLLTGSSQVIRGKFSASNFWKDIVKYKCTAAQYIGEMARYVLTAHQNKDEKIDYVLPKMYGNGMKAQTWKLFIEKFNVKQIFEFYGSTEGNFGFFNLNNAVGSVGYMPIYAEPFSPHCLVKCDPMGNPIRNKAGFFNVVDPDEPGLLICKIGFTVLTKFEGYSDKESTQKKIFRNVFRNDDSYFNTGDIFTRDENGYYYFRDRTGDTFRWKGENVSTNEVEDILGLILNERDVTVYGVEIAGNEGKAGMAAIADPERNVDIEELHGPISAKLPSYSIPMFIRRVNSLPKTGTFKFQKANLQKQGYDIHKIDDELYFLDLVKKRYVPLKEELYDQIVQGKIKV